MCLLSASQVSKALFKQTLSFAKTFHSQRARNKFFQSATEAFRRGEGMAARDLAKKGRELNEKMKDKHRQAAIQIFVSRNPGNQVPIKSITFGLKFQYILFIIGSKVVRRCQIFWL